MSSARRRIIWVVALAAAGTVALNAGAADAASIQLPGGQAVPGELLVGFHPGTTSAQRDSILSATGGQVVATTPQLGLYLVKLPAVGQSAGGLASAEHSLAASPAIAYAQPNYIVHAAFVPNDPDLSQQWGLTKIDAEPAWDVTLGGSSVKIAVVDTGIQANHPDLAGKVVGGYDFVHNTATPTDDNGHGTWVAGIASADTNNGIGVAGTCPDCSLLDVKVLDSTGAGTTANVISGITWAADHGAQIINLSLGASSSTAMNDAVDYAWSKGSFLSCAAGNNSSSSSNWSPAGAADCFAVAATTSTDSKASFSNYGSWVKVAAPGEIILGPWLGSQYKSLSGTSASAPFVSGLAGLLASRGETNQQIANTICNTADQIAGTGTDWKCGRIDAAAALRSTLPHATLIYTAPDSGDYDDPLTLSATLTNSSTSAAISGKTVTFSLGAESCTGTTDSSGIASCQVTPIDPPARGPYSIAATFAGDATYQASSDMSHSFTATREEAATTYTGPTVLQQGTGAVTLTGQLLEDGDSLVPIAGRPLALSLGDQSCTATTDASGNASCTVIPSGVLAGQPLAARFAGDGLYRPSADTSKSASVPSETVTSAVTVAIGSRATHVVHGRAKVNLICSGDSFGAVCVGKLTLTLRENGKTILIARASYDIAGGHSEAIALRISRGGLSRLARNRHHRLRVTAVAALSGGTTARRAVRLRR